MDEAAAAAIKEDGTEKKPHNGDGASDNSLDSTTEDTADINQVSLTCKDCGLKFTHLEVYKTHLHQHALEVKEDEEEEAAQTEGNRNLAGELNSGRGDGGESGDGCDMTSQTKPSGSTQGAGVDSTKTKFEKGYSCLVCGKVYAYLVSFRKHQQLHETPPPTAKSQIIQNVHKYECPECGMSFIRRARLRGHLRVHRSRRSFIPPRCEQCNKAFASETIWLAHVELHKQKPFWCLSCAKGFADEVSLDRHLQRHKLRQHRCDICHKSFLLATQLMNHHSVHTEAKSHLMSRRKKHFRAHVGSSAMPLIEKVITNVKEEPETDPDVEERSGMEKSETQRSWEDAGSDANSDESDCGEPLHHFKPSKAPGSAGSDPPDESKSEAEEPEESQPREANMHGEHKYWEWECCECDMGFDEMAKLHLHYIKHATGELPIPPNDIED